MIETEYPPVPTESGLTDEQFQSLTESLTSAVYTAVVDAQQETASLMEAGEILVPGGEEITVIEVLQSLFSYFQEDDNALLSDIRNHLNAIHESVGVIQYNVAHPFLETPFEQYTVTEGLLLLLVLWLVVINPCIKMIKGGFSWLLS